MSFQIYFCKWFCEGSSQTVQPLHTEYPGDRNTSLWWVNSVKERYSRPWWHGEDQRPDTNTLVPAVLENKVQAPTCRRTSPVLTFFRQQKVWAVLRKTKITKCWHESRTGGGRVKNHLCPHLSHYSSQFLTSPSLRLLIPPPFKKNPFTFISSIPILSTDLLSLSPFPFSENICSHVQ